MKQDHHKPLSNLSVSLPPFTDLQLSRLAEHYGHSLEESAVIAIHMAYLELLEEQREWAMSALNLHLNQPDFDDEMPFMREE